MRLATLLIVPSSLMVLSTVACMATPAELKAVGATDSDATAGSDEDDASASLPPSTRSAPTDAAAGDTTTTTTKDAATSADAEADTAAPPPPPPPLLPSGSTCTLSSECAGGFCLPFSAGLRCTKACTKDFDCPNNNDCGANPRVCEL